VVAKEDRHSTEFVKDGDIPMTRLCSISRAGILTACLFATAGLLARAEDAASKPEAKPADAAAPAKDTASPAKDAVAPPPAKPKPELSPALAAVRDQVRSTLAMHQKLSFNTRENSATEIMAYCQAFGCSAEVSLEGSNGRRINGVTCLCWNYPCAGFEILGLSQGHIAARVGYGYQEHPGEFLAMLALARVPSDYPVRVAHDTRSVADVVEAEKLSCRSGSDMSLKLIGLSYYVDEPEWKNDLGEAWSIERIVQEEVTQPVVTAPEGGLNRLMGLSYAVARRAKRGQPIDGQFQRAQKYVTDFHAFALQLQNSDGSWGPYFLAAKSTSPDMASQLRSTGRVLEWLAMSLPDRQLEDAHVVNAVECVARQLGSQRYQWNTPSLSTREIVAVGHALHALTVYDERVFKPADAVEKPAADNPPSAAAQRDAKASKSR
jgi:hypothetical protein